MSLMALIMATLVLMLGATLCKGVEEAEADHIVELSSASWRPLAMPSSFVVGGADPTRLKTVVSRHLNDFYLIPRDAVQLQQLHARPGEQPQMQLNIDVKPVRLLLPHSFVCIHSPFFCFLFSAFKPHVVFSLFFSQQPNLNLLLQTRVCICVCECVRV